MLLYLIAYQKIVENYRLLKKPNPSTTLNWYFWWTRIRTRQINLDLESVLDFGWKWPESGFPTSFELSEFYNLWINKYSVYTWKYVLKSKILLKQKKNCLFMNVIKVFYTYEIENSQKWKHNVDIFLTYWHFIVNACRIRYV